MNQIQRSDDVASTYVQLPVRYLVFRYRGVKVRVFLSCLISRRLPNVGGGAEMSENYKFYAQKMAERRAAGEHRPLRGQLAELMRVVQRCEARWALEDRIEHSR
jgi:hypothetical protein